MACAASEARSRTYAGLVDDDLRPERPRTSWGMRLLGLAVVIIVAWVLLFPVLSIASSLFALALYVIIAFVAYQVGKAVGRSSRE
jgi:hypothetical protein